MNTERWASVGKLMEEITTFLDKVEVDFHLYFEARYGCYRLEFGGVNSRVDHFVGFRNDLERLLEEAVAFLIATAGLERHEDY